MPLYEYRCRECSLSILLGEPDLEQVSVCSHCNSAIKRVFSVNVPSPRTVFEPHYNYSVGAYVKSWADFTHKLRRRQDRNTEVTGIDHSYTPIHPADYKPSNLGVTSEGIDNARFDQSTSRTFT